MKRHIKSIKIAPHSQQWHEYRYSAGIGGSEIGSVVATRSKTIAELSWSPPLKWYLEKIGENTQPFTGNISSNMGHVFEPIILDWYKYYDVENAGNPTEAQMNMFENIRNKNRINRVMAPKCFIKNSKYPWLSYSPDGFGFRNGKKYLLESKLTTSMESNRYATTNKISPLFYLQVMQGLLLTELPAADLCMLVDGKWYTITTVEPHKETQELIIESSHEMWQKVLKARELKRKYELPCYFAVNPDSLTEKQKEGVDLLTQLEPDLIGTDAELSFLKDMIRPSEEDNAMQGTEEQLVWCKEYLELGEKQDEFEIERKKRYAWLIQSLNGFNRASFDDKSFFSYKSTANGSRKIHISPKVKQ